MIFFMVVRSYFLHTPIYKCMCSNLRACIHTWVCVCVTKQTHTRNKIWFPELPPPPTNRILPFLRHGDHRGVSGRPGQRHGRPGRECGSRAAVLPDPPHGEDGPAGRHVEAPRLGGLRAQTGRCGFGIYVYANGRFTFVFVVVVLVVVFWMSFVVYEIWLVRIGMIMFW